MQVCRGLSRLELAEFCVRLHSGKPVFRRNALQHDFFLVCEVLVLAAVLVVKTSKPFLRNNTLVYRNRK